MEEIVRKGAAVGRQEEEERRRRRRKGGGRRAGFYIKGEGRVWFAEIRGFSNDL